MPRYFLEIAYTGTAYSGFQTQLNANTIQAEAEKALSVFYRTRFELTGSSRTDAGVHALQNYFHFDADAAILPKHVYNINAILPADIVIKKIIPVKAGAHCRFDAISRTYKYFITQNKNPFVLNTAYYYPYTLSLDRLNTLAQIAMEYTDFSSFSKRNTQVKNFLCSIKTSEWLIENDCFVYHVSANRFLRGMVRALTGTMLRVARSNSENTEQAFRKIIEAKDCTMADFSVPPHGLFLLRVDFAEGYYNDICSDT